MMNRSNSYTGDTQVGNKGPVLSFRVDEDSMLRSRLIYLGFVVLLFVAAFSISEGNGEGLRFILYGSVLLVPIGVMLGYEMRFPKRIEYLGDRLQVYFWFRRPIEISLSGVCFEAYSGGVKVCRIVDSNLALKLFLIPRGFPGYSDLLEVLGQHGCETR